MKIFKHSNLFFIILLFILCCIFFAKLFYPEPKIIATEEVGINDIWYFNFPLKNFFSEQLKQGHLPLWNPYRGGGFPDLAESQVGALNFYNLIAFWLMPTITAFNFGQIIIFFTAGLGTYLFAKRQKFSPLLSFYGAVIYAFSGFFITHLSHYLLIQAACYFPLLMYLSDKILKDKKIPVISSLLFPIVLSQQIFSGNPQTVFISILGLFLFSFLLYISKKVTIWRIFFLILTIFIGFIISSAQLLPILELMKNSYRGSGADLSQLLFFKYPFSHLLTFLNPFWFGNPQKGTYPNYNDFNGSIFWENTGYIGIIPLILIAFSFLNYSKIKNQLFIYCTIILFSFLLMLGGNSPIYFILTYPPFSFFRFPSRFMILLLFAMVILSLYGFKFILQKIKNQQIFISFLLITVSIFDIFFIWYNYHPTIAYKEYSKEPISVELLKKENHGKIYSYLQNVKAWKEFSKTGSQKPELYLQLKNEIASNLNVFYELTSSDTYSSISPKRLTYFNSILPIYFEISTNSAEINPLIERRLSLRNTTHILSPIPLINKNFKEYKQIDLKYDLGKVYIYKNLAALPKYYAVNKYKLATTLNEFENKINDPNFDPMSEIIIETAVENISSKELLNSKIQIINEKSDGFKLEVEVNQPSILVINNTFYPGWKAEINGKPTKIFPVNLVNQGLILNKGKNLISLKFVSETYQYGKIISIIGYFVLIMVLIVIIFKNCHLFIRAKFS